MVNETSELEPLNFYCVSVKLRVVVNDVCIKEPSNIVFILSILVFMKEKICVCTF